MPRESKSERQAATDLEHLRMLSIFYYIFSGLMALCALFPIIHFIVGIGIVAGGFGPPAPAPQGAGGQPQQPPIKPELFGWIFIVVAGLAMLFGWTMSVCSMVAARSLRRRKRYVFCLVTAGIACLQQPFGTALGVFTIIVLTRPSVKALFQRESLPAQPELELDHDHDHDRYHHDE